MHARVACPGGRETFRLSRAWLRGGAAVLVLLIAGGGVLAPGGQLDPPRPKGPALAIVTNAGGPGVMATDELMTRGGQLAPLSADTLAALNAALPPFWSHGNPVDVLGDATPERYRKAVEACAADPNVQGLLVLLTPQAMTDPTETARQLAPFARLPNKPVLASWMGGAAVRAGQRLLNQAGIPTFGSPEAAIRAFLHMVQYRRAQDLLYETPEALPDGWGIMADDLFAGLYAHLALRVVLLVWPA